MGEPVRRLIATAQPRRIDGNPCLLVTFAGGETRPYDDDAQIIRYLQTLGWRDVAVHRPKQVFCMCRTWHGRITISGVKPS